MSKTTILTLMYSCMLFLPVLLWSQTKKPATAAKSTNTLKLSIARGKAVYADQCLVCHQADGGGVQNMNPPLIKTKWVLGDKSVLINIVLKGMNTETEINGDVYHNIMPPHEFMTDQQIADVLTYIRNSFGNKAKAITQADVKAVRAKAK
jgi:mono/diheme cytochrome c family protein